MPNYSDIVLTRSTRTDENPICNCFICLTGRDTRQLPASKGRGHVRNLFHEIQKGEGLIGSSQDNRLPPVHQGNKKKSLTICQKCKQEIGRGLPHQCSIASSSMNIVDHVLELPDKQQEQVASALLDMKAKVFTDKSQNIELNLSTKGSRARVILNPANSQRVNFTEDSLDNLQ